MEPKSPIDKIQYIPFSCLLSFTKSIFLT